MIDYFRAVVGHEANRCSDCYRLRLSETAKTAASQNYNAFTTTMLISPYQNHQQIREIGSDLAEKYGVEFYYEDFSIGFRKSQQMAREMELYRQSYCGCVYSEWERYTRFKIE